jgi:hypothetical protein
MTELYEARNIDPALLTDPRFQALLGKAATHQRKFRPLETKQLEKDSLAQNLNKDSLLMQILLERTQTCWLALKSARQNGMTMLEAQEVAFPIILLPDERDEQDEKNDQG